MFAFGYPVPQDLIDTKGQPNAYWGARAIFHPNRKNPIDILHDRQNFHPEGVESPALIHWLNHKALPWLREQVKGISTMSETVFKHTEGIRTIIASTNQSAGYLYIGAFQYNGENTNYEMQEAPVNVRLIQPGEDLLKLKPLHADALFFSAPVLPNKGDRVKINFNNLGTGQVVDYFVEHRLVGVRVKLDKQPEWHLKNNGPWPYALVFGNEIKLEPK